MNQKLTTEALDKAITKVVCDEFNRISKNLSTVETAQKVEYALVHLKNLQYSIMPEYDEWVAPFYVSWYQPAQINLAYSMITDMVEETFDGALAPKGTLYVYDFGCGALAMQFGVALAAADALRKGQKLDSVYIASSDTSEAMIRIGVKVWEQFKSEVRKEPCLSRLSQVCDLIEMQNVSHSPYRKPSAEDTRWLSAIHAVYDTNEGDVQKCLCELGKLVSPNVVFLTTHYKEDSLLCKASPFRNNQYEFNKRDVSPSLSGEFREVTNLRKGISEKVQTELPNPPGVDTNLIRKYLKGNVKWNWRTAAIHIYTRRQQ